MQAPPRRSAWRATLALAAAALVALPAFATAEGDCELRFRVTPQYDARPRTLAVSMTFPTEGRSETDLIVNEPWSGIDNFSASLDNWRGADDFTQVMATSQPRRMRVTHRPSGMATVTFQARGWLPEPDDATPQEPSDGYRTQIGKDWFQFFGHSVFPTLALWDNDRLADICMTIDQPNLESPPVLGSYFAGRGNEVTRRLRGSRRQLVHAFYAGGTGWRLVDRPLTRGALHLALRGTYAADDTMLADKMATLIDTQRRFWGDQDDTAPRFVITPNHAKFTAGTVVEEATMLHVSEGFAPSSSGFQFVVGHENLHQWIPLRLGSTANDGTTYWLSEGFTDYYTNRLLLASGLWSREQYATALTRALRQYWQSPARNETVGRLEPRLFSDRDAFGQLYARGQMLAMRWDRSLRDVGQPGLDAVLRGLLLPIGTDPRTSPLATERFLAALAPTLGESPRRDVKRFADEGEDFPIVAELAGPCFRVVWEDVARPTSGVDATGFDRLPTVKVVADTRSEAACASWVR